MWPIVFVCVSVLDITVMCAKTAQLMEMPFGVWTRVGPRNPYQLGPRSPQGKQQLFGVPPVMQPFWHQLPMYPYAALRASSSGDLVVLQTNRQISDRAFSVTTLRYWNRLHADRAEAAAVDQYFCHQLKTFLFPVLWIPGNRLMTLWWARNINDSVTVHPG